MSYVETGLGRGFFFFFNDTATTEIYTLSLHDALPICPTRTHCLLDAVEVPVVRGDGESADPAIAGFGLALHGEELNQRSEEHTSELQSRQYLVCRLLLEKKKPHASLPYPAPSRLTTTS